MSSEKIYLVCEKSDPPILVDLEDETKRSVRRGTWKVHSRGATLHLPVSYGELEIACSVEPGPDPSPFIGLFLNGVTLEPDWIEWRESQIATKLPQ